MTTTEALQLSAEIRAHLLSTARKDYILACDRKRFVRSKTMVDAIERGRTEYQFATKEAA